MKVSLRKANALQAGIVDALKTLTITTDINLSEYVDAASVMSAAVDKMIDTLSRRTALLNAQYDIRKLVNQANTDSGISDRLTAAALIDKQIADLKIVASVDVSKDMSEVEARLAKIRLNDPNRSLYGETTVATSLVSVSAKAEFTAQLASLKKLKQDLNDKVLELNIKTEITLSDDTVSVLTKEGLV